VTVAPEQKNDATLSPAVDGGAGKLFGIGEMADLARAFDWGQTSIGPIDRWPEVLLNTVNTLLNSRHPMFLWWGEDLVQFYNDAYRPSLGEGKHPRALGQKGEDCWPEIWPIIFPQIEAVMTRGEASWHENQLVPIIRNGRLEDVYWTYGYSAVYTPDGERRPDYLHWRLSAVARLTFIPVVSGSRARPEYSTSSPSLSHDRQPVQAPRVKLIACSLRGENNHTRSFRYRVRRARGFRDTGRRNRIYTQSADAECIQAIMTIPTKLEELVIGLE
jgi:hypothetical protein